MPPRAAGSGQRELRGQPPGAGAGCGRGGREGRDPAAPDPPRHGGSPALRRPFQPSPHVLPLRLGAVLCPGPLCGLASAGSCRKGTWEMDGAMGMGEQTLSRHLNGSCFRAETVAFCGGSSGLENREEESPSGVGTGGLASRGPVPTVTHVSFHSETASVPGLLCSIHVGLLPLPP